MCLDSKRAVFTYPLTPIFLVTLFGSPGVKIPKEALEKAKGVWKYETLFRGSWSFLNLLHMKPENTKVNPKSVKQPFISNLTIDFNDKQIVNMSIWNGPIR